MICRFIAITLLVCGCHVALAQTTPQASPSIAQLPPLPPGPPIAKVPKGQWTVSVTVSRIANAQAQGANKQPPKPAEVVQVVKDNRIRYEAGNDYLGKYVRWCTPEGQFIKREEVKDFALDSTETEDGDPVNCGSSDFPECGWVTVQDYASVQRLENNTDCFVFMNSKVIHHANLLQDPPGSHLCYVDQKTRLPVMSIQPGRTYLYQFSASPPPPLTLPEEIQKLIHTLKRHFDDLQRRNGPA